MRNKPTKSMQNAAAEGVKLFTAGNFPVNSVTPRSLEVGKKIASGQDLADDHINDMAHYHASHDTCPKDCEDLLWGGPAGEVWAKGKLMQALNTGFAEENIDFNKLITDKDLNLSLEIYSDNLDEPKEETDDGLIWAPIARSGMLATRPGPNGEKIDSPLVFIPGHSDDPRKEIGLQDIHDAFKDKAHEHVTIPIDMRISGEDIPAHNNRMYQNTGEILDTKIIDSNKIPGEKVLVGLHKFTEPDTKGKVERGTYPSRSCGLLYDYKNTTTGKVYPISLDHVALTHKPWVGGMAPYGSDEFSDRTYIPMMLSEKPLTINIHPVEKFLPTKLAQETTKPQQSTNKVDSEFLADVQWGDEPSYGDIRNQISQILDGFTGDNDSYPNYFLIDCTGDKALVKVDYGIGPDQDAWVVPYEVQDGKVQLDPFANWTDVTKKWVSDTIDPKQDKEQLDKLKMSNDKEAIASLYLSVPQAKRDRAKAAGHALPDGSYPIENTHDLHSAAVLAASGHGDVNAAKALIRRRAKDLGVDINSLPGFGPKKESKTSMSDPLKMASANRLGLSEKDNYQPIGGPMTLLAMSEEKMELLGLSDEAKEFQRRQNQEILKMSDELKVSQKEKRETSVENKISKYKEEGIDQFPGLLREYEVTALSDDGDVAVKLYLSENGYETTRIETATQIAERFMAAIPRKDGKVNLGEFASKLETPDLNRPDLKPDDPNAEKKVITGRELLAQMLTDDPSLARDPEFLALSENGKGQ